MDLEEKPWIKNYTKGVPEEIDFQKYQVVLDIISEAIKKYGSSPAFYYMEKAFSYQAIDLLSTRFAAYLQSIGFKKGDHIALMMPNIIQYPIALYGCIKAGIVVVNTNPLYMPREMLFQFNDSHVKGIVIAENFAYNLQSIIEETKIKHVIIASIGEMLGFLKGNLVNFIVRKVKKIIPKYQIPNHITFKSALELGKKSAFKPVKSESSDLISLQYTGGTTGVSKGAMLSNANLVANMLQIRSIFLTKLESEGECSICPLPFYHIFAFNVHCLALFSLGCPSVLVVNPRDIPAFVKIWQKYPITIFPGINTLFNALLNNKDFRQIDFTLFKAAVAGGMALQGAVYDKWFEVTKTKIVEGYGLTETSPVASVNPLDGRSKKGSIGMPVPSTLMRIVDDEGNILAQGQVGEIQIKGPQVMMGYYNQPNETLLCLKDGWFSSGDIGSMDEDGYFKIVDRKKDMILVSGFNVYPNEIEDVAVMHPKILEAAAIGVPDEKSTEAVKLYVVKKDETLTEQEIMEHMSANLTNYKRPKYIEFRAELPKTNVGKILRKNLRSC